MRRKYLIAGLICVLLCIVSLLLAKLPQGSDQVSVSKFESDDYTLPPTSSESSKTEKEYKSPIDFSKLKQIDPNVYAWLKIPGTNINYPVAQSATDDNYYLKHTIYGDYSDYGTLFTEHLYNSKSFDDPVTIIYGHHMYTDAMFGSLQQLYADSETFEKLDKITVFCPDRELNYKVFAAVPFSNQHILYRYNCFKDPDSLPEFIEEIFSIRAFDTNYDEDFKIKKNDRVLILSTCLQGNRNKRYLVFAKLADKK